MVPKATISQSPIQLFRNALLVALPVLMQLSAHYVMIHMPE